MALQLAFSTQVHAEPVFTATECIKAGHSGWNLNRGEPIAVYIESDLGSELDACITTGDADGISDLQARNVVRAAFEVWNREARAAVFHYAGTKAYENILTSEQCEAFVDKPAVYVRFEPGCGGDCGEAISHTRPVDGCTNIAQITVLGDGNTTDACTGTGIFQWNVTGDPSSEDLFTNLVHEFGHALDLGHPFGVSGGDPTDDHSVMNGTSSPLDRHLYPWEMDCVDEAITSGININHRDVRDLPVYRYKGIEFDGDWASLAYGPYPVKGFFGGGHLHESGSSSDPMYAFYMQSEVYSSSVDTNGSFSFSAEPDYDCNPELEDLYTAPVLMKTHEYTSSGQAQRINYARYATSSISDYSAYDPPRRRYTRSDNFFDTCSATSSYFESNGTTYVQSHIPMVSAYDAHTGHTVFAVVDTFRNLANHGKIRVYPGFAGSSSNYLSSFSILSDNQTIPSDSDPDFNYTLKTDVTPGVACAPDRNTFAYNCILAWMDRGHPDYRVLYTYFRVDESDPDDLQVDWIKGTPNVWVRSGAYTHSDISAAFFDDSFWLAWKADDTDQDVEWCRTTTSHTSWTAVDQIGVADVVDAPTWLYTPNATQEAALIWTQY